MAQITTQTHPGRHRHTKLAPYLQQQTGPKTGMDTSHAMLESVVTAEVGSGVKTDITGGLNRSSDADCRGVANSLRQNYGTSSFQSIPGIYCSLDELCEIEPFASVIHDKPMLSVLQRTKLILILRV